MATPQKVALNPNMSRHTLKSGQVYQDNWETERYELLNTRVCDLKLNFEETLLNRCIEKLYSELAAKKVQYRPGYYFTCGADEWGCPDRVPIIGIPFHLADNKLTRIEREMGYTTYDERDLMFLLRHETGHAISYAYQLYRNEEWKGLFGDFNKTYPSNFKYKFNPFSRNYVKSQGEPKYYAQAHPDEDFAETFAVWLTPRSNWRVVYKNWPAIKKLEYVHRLMVKIRRRKPEVLAGPLHSPYQSKTYTLIEYYGEDLDNFKDKALGIYDDDLNMIFDHYTNGFRKTISAKDLIRRNRRFLITTIATWTGAREKVVAPVINKFFQRCRELNLSTTSEEESSRLASLAALGTAVVMNYLHTGRYIPD